MSDVMMKCGCRADGKSGDKDVCVVHLSLGNPDAQIVVPTPDLTGREAKCTYCNARAPSSIKLAFFKFRGEGSPSAEDTCGKCRYYKCAHERQPKNSDPRSMIERGACTGFVAQGAQKYDEYYCGCRGFD